MAATTYGSDAGGQGGPAERRAGNFQTIDDLDGSHLRVFLRADAYVLHDIAPLNSAAPSELEVPLGASEVAIVSSELVTPEGEPSSLRRLLELGARVFVGTELSREFMAETDITSLEELASRMSERLNADVLMPEELVGDSLVKVAQDLRPGQICLLPDLARAEADAQNFDGLVRRLASHVDAYVGDAFSVCHLHERSFLKLPRLVRQRVLGYRMQHELERLSELGRPASAPLTIVVGGERFSDKAALLNQWLPRASSIAFGGGVANTLLAARGLAVGQSTFEPERLAEARSFLARAAALGVELILPLDVSVRTSSSAWVKGSVIQAARADAEPSEVVLAARIKDEEIVTDLGPDSLRRLGEALARARSVLWWGPLGVAGSQGYAASTLALASTLGAGSMLSVAIGTDLRRSLLALDRAITRGLGLVSTGSLAAQALLGGRRLPGAEVLGDT
jgi:phosphoglycerate kinase